MPDEVNPQNAGAGDGGAQSGGTPPSLGWKTELPESQRSHEAFAPYTTKSDFHKGHVDLWSKYNEAVQKLTDAEGRLNNSIPKLAEDATPEQKEEFFKALGRPETPDQYEFKPINGEELNGKLVDWWKTYSFQEGLPKAVSEKAFQQFSGLISEIAKAENEQRLKVFNDAVEAQTKAWGTDASANTDTIKKVYEKFKTPAFDEMLQLEVDVGGKKVRIGDHPAMLEWALGVGKAMLPDTIPPGEQPKGQPVKPAMIYPDMKT